MTVFAVRWANRENNTVYSRATYDSADPLANETANQLGYEPVDETVFKSVTVLFEPEPTPEVDPVTQVYNELDAAYTAGYQEGVDNV